MNKANKEQGFYFSNAAQESYVKSRAGLTVHRKSRRIKHNPKKNKTSQDNESISRFISEGSPDTQEKIEHPLELLPSEGDDSQERL